MSGLATRLAGHPFLSGLEPAMRVVLADCAREAHFESGQTIFHEGGQADAFYLIEGGDVGLFMATPNRPATPFMSLHEGDLLGVSWLFPPYRWLFTARALSRVDSQAIDARCLRHRCDEDPRLGYALMRLFSGLLIRRLQAARLQMLDVYANPGGES